MNILSFVHRYLFISSLFLQTHIHFDTQLLIPPLAGVTVRMTVKDNGKMKMVESVSNENGEYSFTPISQDAEIISLVVIPIISFILLA